MAADPQMIAERHGVSLRDENFQELGLEVRRNMMDKAYEFYSGAYLRPLTSILSDVSAMPHLELMDWEDRIALPETFFNSIVNCAAKHVKFQRVSVVDQFEICLTESLKARG